MMGASHHIGVQEIHRARAFIDRMSTSAGKMVEDMKVDMSFHLVFTMK